MEIKRLIVGMVQTNCYIAVHPETKEAVIVDPGDEAARIEDALAQTGAKAKAILLTHGHFDHVTAMEELRRDLGVPGFMPVSRSRRSWRIRIRTCPSSFRAAVCI